MGTRISPTFGPGVTDSLDKKKGNLKEGGGAYIICTDWHAISARNVPSYIVHCIMYRLPSHSEGGAPHKKISRSDRGCCIDCISRRMQLEKLNRKTGTVTEARLFFGGQFWWERLPCIHTLGLSIWNLCKTTDTFWHLTRHTLAQIRRMLASPYLHMPSASFIFTVDLLRRRKESEQFLHLGVCRLISFPVSFLLAALTSLWMRHWLAHLGNTFGTRHVTRPGTSIVDNSSPCPE